MIKNRFFSKKKLMAMSLAAMMLLSASAWQTFEFEFNMGNQGSTGTIHIRNVRLEKID